jgi:hypothetical protein
MNGGLAAMKYFTEAFAFGGLTDEQFFAAKEAYAARIEDIKSQLSPEMSELATSTVNLHDGLIRHVALDRPARRLSLGLRCGDLQVGYFDVDLVYADVDLNLLNSAVLEAIATDPETELLYNEIDLESAGRFVHRIIFWPRPMREIEVVFRSLMVSIEPRHDRKVRRMGFSESRQ